MHIVILALDSMHVHNFHYQTVAGAKLSLFLEFIIVLLCLLIIILVLDEGPTQELDDTTKTAEVNILLIFQNQEKDLC